MIIMIIIIKRLACIQECRRISSSVIRLSTRTVSIHLMSFVLILVLWHLQAIERLLIDSPASKGGAGFRRAWSACPTAPWETVWWTWFQSSRHLQAYLLYKSPNRLTCIQGCCRISSSVIRLSTLTVSIRFIRWRPCTATPRQCDADMR